MSYLLLGASRGLGFEFAQLLNSQELATKSYSRTINGMDFTKSERWVQYLEHFVTDNPQLLIYFAGGGPYGAFHQKEFKDHQWALRLNYEFPAYLLHSLLQHHKSFPQLRQVCFIGSAVAESKPDKYAASYSAGKHALKGLITSVQLENPPFDLRLFSPSYMDTAMLPPDAWPRQNPTAVKNPSEVAGELWAWLHQAQFANGQLVL